MATQAVQQPTSTAIPNVVPIAKPKSIVPIKVGIYGPQGSGKTVTTALMAAALSAQFYNRAPVYVVDPDLAWQFAKVRIFAVEGIELIQKPYRSFKQMDASLREAEKAGACCWAVDPLTLIWNELMDTYRGKKGFVAIDQWGDLRQVWNGYIKYFLNSPMNCFAAGRLGSEFEEREEETSKGETKTKLVKVGTKFKAGGGESFGYEPHLLLEMSLERKPKKTSAGEIEGEGRMVHRADVLKDRTWILNGKVLRFSDRSGYRKGDWSYTWNAVKSHFNETQLTGEQVQIIPGSSAELVNSNGASEYQEKRERRDAISNEITETLDHLFGGTSQEAKHLRRCVTEHIFGIKSKENVEKLNLGQLERGLRILQAFEKRSKADGKLLGSGELNILSNLDIDIREYDEGKAVEEELPF